MNTKKTVSTTASSRKKANASRRKEPGLGRHKSFGSKKWGGLLFVVGFAVVGGLSILLTHAAALSSGPIVGIADKCVNNEDGKFAKGNVVRLYTCNGKASSEKWTMTASSTLSMDNNKYCLDVKGEGVALETHVQLWTCNGKASQKWVSLNNGTLENTHSKLCLDDEHSGEANGNTLWIYTCTASDAQMWKVSQSTTPAAAKYAPANGKIYLGVSTDGDRLSAFDTAAGIKTQPAIFNVYTAADGQLQTYLNNVTAISATVTPMISWNVSFTNDQITNGSEDSYIKAQAAAIKAYNKPVFLRLDWEMNGNWYPNYDVEGGVTPAEYVASWQHIVNLFKADGVTNAAFVWCTNGGDIPNAQRVSAWYPGDSYVDWISLDDYPQFTTPSNYLYGTDQANYMAEFANIHNKPLMLAEWAPDLPEPDTAAPIDLVFDWAEQYPSTVKALVYFDFDKPPKDFTLKDHPVGAAEFRRLTVGNSIFIDNSVQ